MEHLWAPWRLSYVKHDDDAKGAERATLPDATGCIFCDKPRENDDAANLIVARVRTCFTILNAFPYNNGHLMVVPYRHLSHPADLTAAENAEMMQTAAHATRILDKVYRSDGYNIGMNVGSAAGAGIAAHLHLHVVPRWSGDTNFMPVLGAVKVLPEMLAQAYEKIRATWEDAAAEDLERESAAEV